MAILKTSSDGYLLNTDTNVVLNTNDSELQSYRALIQQTKEMTSLKSEMAELKRLLLEIKR